jgi:putative hydrolase of HD superfamily
MDINERLKKQFEFLQEIDKEKNVFRQTYLADGNRK